MIFSFEHFCSLVKKIAKEEYPIICYGSSYGNTIILLIFYYIWCNNCLMMPKVFGYIGLILGGLILIIYFISRKIGIAAQENKYFYISFWPFYKVKKQYEIKKENIRYITVHKVLSVSFIKLSFINEKGKLITLRFLYNSVVIGLRGQKENSVALTKNLLALEKEIDKGDF